MKKKQAMEIIAAFAAMYGMENDRQRGRRAVKEPESDIELPCRDAEIQDRAEAKRARRAARNSKQETPK